MPVLCLSIVLEVNCLLHVFVEVGLLKQLIEAGCIIPWLSRKSLLTVVENTCNARVVKLNVRKHGTKFGKTGNSLVMQILSLGFFFK